MYAGKFEDAVAQGKKASDLNADYALAWVSQALGNAALGKYDEALAAYKELSTKPGWEARAALGVADIALLRGRINEAAAALEPMAAANIPSPQQRARVQTTLAGVRLSQGRTPDAIKLAEAAYGLSQDPITTYEAGRILLAGGRAERVKQLIAELDKSLSPETQALGLTLAGEAQLVTARDARAAIQSFQQALKLADSWQTRYLLGRAYLEAEAVVQAEGEFDACVDRRGEATAMYLDDVPTWRVVAPAYYYQGLARTAMKNTDGAANAFKTFVAFKDGGDDQSSLVTDAKKRLAQ
jgi:tetratricopeptide (TPR) repeat protein